MAHLSQLGTLSERPLFNTKAVARKTGVPADTFRTWERRYGVPRPQRTASLHRRYSDRDIAIICWLRDRTAEGMNIGHAVQLLASTLEATPEVSADIARSIERLHTEFMVALTSFDQPNAERLVNEAFALYPFETVLLDLLEPVMVEIGERWQRNEINVVAEHFASQFIYHKLAGLLHLFEGNTQHATIIVGCAPEELHELGTLMVALFLTRRGWHVIYLGALVPLTDLIATVQTLKPALVCLSASLLQTALGLSEVAHALKSAAPDVLFGYGGRAFNINPELRRAVPGIFLGQNARELVDRIAGLLQQGSVLAIEG
jgi:MerR family transcriptional regulator, light-induced transcriptional regulator